MPWEHDCPDAKSKNYEYFRQGLYFITVCIQNRLCLFGKIINDEIMLNDAGKMVTTVWNEIPIYYEGFHIHEFVVMPNHIHGIIQIVSKPNPVGAGPCACPIAAFAT